MQRSGIKKREHFGFAQCKLRAEKAAQKIKIGFRKSQISAIKKEAETSL